MPEPTQNAVEFGPLISRQSQEYLETAERVTRWRPIRLSGVDGLWRDVKQLKKNGMC